AILQKQAEQQGRVCRLPARDIEQQVTRQLEQWLGTGRALLEHLAVSSDDAATHATLLAGTKVWKDLGTREPAQVRAFLLATLRRITVEETAVHLALSRAGLRAVLLRGQDTPATVLTPTSGQEDHEDVIEVSVNVTLRRCAKGIRLIVPGEA